MRTLKIIIGIIVASQIFPVSGILVGFIFFDYSLTETMRIGYSIGWGLNLFVLLIALFMIVLNWCFNSEL